MDVLTENNKSNSSPAGQGNENKKIVWGKCFEFYFSDMPANLKEVAGELVTGT